MRPIHTMGVAVGLVYLGTYLALGITPLRIMRDVFTIENMGFMMIVIGGVMFVWTLAPQMEESK